MAHRFRAGGFWSTLVLFGALAAVMLALVVSLACVGPDLFHPGR
jgi:hypothetical protein